MVCCRTTSAVRFLLLLFAHTLPSATASCVRLANGSIDCSGRGRAAPPPTSARPSTSGGFGPSPWSSVLGQQWGRAPAPASPWPANPAPVWLRPTAPAPVWLRPTAPSLPPPAPPGPRRPQPVAPATCISRAAENVGAVVGDAACAEVVRRCVGGPPAPRMRPVCSEPDRDVCLDEAPKATLEAPQSRCLQVLMFGSRFCNPQQSQRIFRDVVEFSCGKVCQQCNMLAQEEGGIWA